MNATIKVTYPKKLVLLLLSIIVAISSCRKTELSKDTFVQQNIASKFLELPENADTVLKLIAKKIQKDEDRYHMLSYIARRDGNPLWDKAVLVSNSNPSITNGLNARTVGEEETQYLIPLTIKGSNKIFSMFAGTVKGDSVNLRLLRAQNFRSYGFDKSNKLNAETVVGLSMFLENRVYGTENFVWHDRRLFSETVRDKDSALYRFLKVKSTTSSSSGSTNRTTGSITVSICLTIQAPVCGDGLDPACNAYHDVTRCFSMYSWETPTPDPGGGGSGTLPDFGDGSNPYDQSWSNSSSAGAPYNPNIRGYHMGLPILTDGVLSQYYYANISFWEQDQAFRDLTYEYALPPQDFTTDGLRNLCTARGWNTGDLTAFNRMVGKAFEESALSYYGLKENGSICASPRRAAYNAYNPSLPQGCRPDALDHTQIYSYNDQGVSIDRLDNVFAAEVKAVPGVLNLSDNAYQILGELEYIRNNFERQMNSPIWQTRSTPNLPINVNTVQAAPTLFFITTADTEIGQSIINEAQTLGVNIWQAKAIFDPNTSKIGFSEIKYVYDRRGAGKGTVVPREFITGHIFGGPESPAFLATPVNGANFNVDPEMLGF